MSEARAVVPFGKNIVINTKLRLQRYDNGGARAYEAHDTKNPGRKFIALVSGVESLPRWTAVTAYDSLSDMSFMRMVGNGIVNWPAENTQKYVFMYDYKLGERLLKKGEFNDLGWRHPEIVEFLIQPVVRVLREMQDKSFNHGSIRPWNIFHSSSEKKGQVILGDCLSVQSNSTQPEVFLPIEYSCCDPMGRGNGSISNDIYAFGVTLAMFLRKNDELAGLNAEDILRRKIELGSFTTIVGKERFPSVFLEVLRGTLHDDPSQRWGLEELFSWLDGTRMNPPPAMKRKKANRPLVFNGNKYLYADTLAFDFEDNISELAEMIDNGTLATWVEKSLIDPGVFERFNKAVERVEAMGGATAHRDFTASQFRMAFNPMLPIKYKDCIFNYDGMGNMMAVRCCEGLDLSIFRDVFSLNLADHAVAFKGLPQAEVVTFLRLFDTCRASLRSEKKVGYGIERCIYLLCKNVACMSPVFQSFFVNSHQAALHVYEKLSQNSGQIALYMDQHAIAFFSALNPNGMDRVIYDLDSKDKMRKIIGNLKYLAVMQVQSSNQPVQAVAKVFLDAIQGIYSDFKNKALREKIKSDVAIAAAEGDLSTMLVLLEDHVVRNKDKNAFDIARREYDVLQREYNDYNRKLANKHLYGVSNGHDAAVVVAWLISTIISVFVVFAFISGYRIF